MRETVFESVLHRLSFTLQSTGQEAVLNWKGLYFLKQTRLFEEIPVETALRNKTNKKGDILKQTTSN